MLSDSKGNYIKRIDSAPHFKYICRGGANFRQQYYFVKHKISTFDRNTHFLIFLGTCDLTCKNGRFIKLSSRADSSVNTILHFAHLFKELLDFYGHTYTFLEIPPYTIVGWNEAKGHSDPSSFIEDDVLLNHQIALVNERFREINQQNRVQSPRFSLDLHRSHSRGRARKSNYNFSLYTDGIHPTELLCRSWLKSIMLHAIKFLL